MQSEFTDTFNMSKTLAQAGLPIVSIVRILLVFGLYDIILYGLVSIPYDTDNSMLILILIVYTISIRYK